MKIYIDRTANWCEVIDDSDIVVLRCHEDELFEGLADRNLLTGIQVDWDATVEGPRV